MANYEVRSELWESLSQQEQDQIVRVLKKRGQIAEGDEVVPVRREAPATPLNLPKRGGCPEACNNIAQFEFEACLAEGGDTEGCRECAEQEYMECCLYQEEEL
ncbi:MAG: hypothetical protein GY906_15885 [bacterium]|nr:hypothetical protein [bacterium]